MIKYFVFLITLIVPALSHQATLDFKGQAQLIVFIQASNSAVSQSFKSQVLPQIKTLAETEQLEYVVHEIQENAPKEVSYTPFICYRDHRGQSVFSGRWTQISKIKNFIRSSRVLHQEDEANYKKDVLVWKWGRTALIAPLKITELKGKLPKKFDSNIFQQTAIAAVEKGTARFNLKKQIDVDLSTKSFYWSIYPYRDKKGRYHLTGEIYSQYNCVTPVYTQKAAVVDRNYQKAFEKMAAILEEQVLYQIDNPQNGDGFMIVEHEVGSSSWNQFGQLQSSIQEQGTRNETSFKYKNNWTVKGAFAENTPMIYFKFKQPIDEYTGEVSRLTGELTLDDENSLGHTQGQFSIPVNAITMGATDLDEAIHDIILDSEQYPNASFSFQKIDVLSGSLIDGQTIEVRIDGNMTLKGKTNPIQCKGTIAPYLREDNSYLHVQLSFGINKLNFDIKKGPDGPDEIKENMQFYMNFLMQ